MDLLNRFIHSKGKSIEIFVHNIFIKSNIYQTINFPSYIILVL